uniref:Uncharacterized protein n=1 Tax=Schistosoma japonicum TaxID=6182 RepID=Q5BX26_SCHJA|nr:unknown [Schistosoma japonicum]
MLQPKLDGYQCGSLKCQDGFSSRFSFWSVCTIFLC